MSGWALIGWTLLLIGFSCLIFTLIAWLSSREYDQEMSAWRKRYPAPSMEDTITMAAPLRPLPPAMRDDFLRKLLTVPLSEVASVFDPPEASNGNSVLSTSRRTDQQRSRKTANLYLGG